MWSLEYWMLALAFGAGDLLLHQYPPILTCRQTFSVASVFIWKSRPRMQCPNILIRIIVEILYICITETSLLDLFRFLATKEIKQGHFSMPPVAYISIFLMSKLGAGKFAKEAFGEREIAGICGE